MLSHLKLHFNNAQRNDETVLGAYPSTIRRRVLRYLYLDVLQAGRQTFPACLPLISAVFLGVDWRVKVEQEVPCGDGIIRSLQ